MSNNYFVVAILSLFVCGQGCIMQSQGENSAPATQINDPERDYTYPTPVDESANPNSDIAGDGEHGSPVSDPPMNEEKEDTFDLPKLEEFKAFVAPIPPRPGSNKKIESR